MSLNGCLVLFLSDVFIFSLPGTFPRKPFLWLLVLPWFLILLCRCSDLKVGSLRQGGRHPWSQAPGDPGYASRVPPFLDWGLAALLLASSQFTGRRLYLFYLPTYLLRDYLPSKIWTENYTYPAKLVVSIYPFHSSMSDSYYCTDTFVSESSS